MPDVQSEQPRLGDEGSPGPAVVRRFSVDTAPMFYLVQIICFLVTAFSV